MFYFMSVHSKLILELHPVFPNYTLFIYLSFPSAMLQMPDHATYSVGLWLFVTGFCRTDRSKHFYNITPKEDSRGRVPRIDRGRAVA